MFLGAHLGIARGLTQAVEDLKSLDGEALQIFSKSPQMWSGPPVLPEAAEQFREAVRTSGVRATAVHSGYLINLGSPKTFVLKRSRAAFLDEIRRAELLGVDGLIFHPGAHLGSGPEAGLRTIAASLGKALEIVPEGRTRLLLENAAGQGTALCSTFDELATVLAAVGRPDRVGVALDTCHLFAAGNDFRTEEGYGLLCDRLEGALGREAVHAFHLNDAKAELGSRLDRHENIGKGQIGSAGFGWLVRDSRWKNVPGYLETPLGDDGYGRYAEDLRVLRALAASPSPGSSPKPASARPRREVRTLK